jgi:hypothetical protein
MVLVLLPLLFLTLSACGPSRTEIVQQGRDREPGGSSQIKDDKTNEDNVARARRLDAAAMATVPVAPLTSQESLEDYSSRLADLQFLIESAERDALIQSPLSQWRVQVTPSLNRAKESLASGMITKGKAELAMKDFEAARKTLRQVLAEFDSQVYGGLTRQAEIALQDVEKAAKLAQAQGTQ